MSLVVGATLANGLASLVVALVFVALLLPGALAPGSWLGETLARLGERTPVSGGLPMLQLVTLAPIVLVMFRATSSSTPVLSWVALGVGIAGLALEAACRLAPGVTRVVPSLAIFGGAGVFGMALWRVLANVAAYASRRFHSGLAFLGVAAGAALVAVAYLAASTPMSTGTIVGAPPAEAIRIWVSATELRGAWLMLAEVCGAAWAFWLARLFWAGLPSGSG